MTVAAKVIAFANQKGGVGKTTSAIHIAAAVALLGQRALLVDIDPQGNVASGLGIRKSGVVRGSYDVLIGECAVREAAVESAVPGLFVLPSTLDLVGAENELAGDGDRNFFLANALDEARADYDYIFIDCPPSLGLLTLNALFAADAVVVPMTCDFYAMEGLSQLHISLKKIRAHARKAPELLGILLTMVNARYSLTREVESELRAHYGDRVFKSTISRSVRLAEAPGFGKPVFLTDKKGKSATEYMAAARELMMRI